MQSIFSLAFLIHICVFLSTQVRSSNNFLNTSPASTLNAKCYSNFQIFTFELHITKYYEINCCCGRDIQRKRQSFQSSHAWIFIKPCMFITRDNSIGKMIFRFQINEQESYIVSLKNSLCDNRLLTNKVRPCKSLENISICVCRNYMIYKK